MDRNTLAVKARSAKNSISTIKLFGILAFLLVLSGCEVLHQITQSSATHSKAPVIEPLALCTTVQQVDEFAEFCEIETWLAYALDVMPMSWQERRDIIEALGDDNASLLRKVILSQGIETPYQNRLRAQNWLKKLSNSASQNMGFLLKDVMFENSKQLLEFESAITILSRVNARQEKTIQTLQAQLEERQKEIEKQQSQVEQLLKIETDLINQNRQENR